MAAEDWIDQWADDEYDDMVMEAVAMKRMERVQEHAETCGGSLVRRSRKKDGHVFMGCSQWPVCTFSTSEEDF